MTILDKVGIFKARSRPYNKLKTDISPANEEAWFDFDRNEFFINKRPISWAGVPCRVERVTCSKFMFNGRTNVKNETLSMNVNLDGNTDPRSIWVEANTSSIKSNNDSGQALSLARADTQYPFAGSKLSKQ